MSEFTHLHLHTEYSLLDGACDVYKLVDRVVALGQKSVAMTDHGNIYGAVHFFDAAEAKTMAHSPTDFATSGLTMIDLPCIRPSRIHVREPLASGRETTCSSRSPVGDHLVRQTHSS